jgi:hypothetical protein
MKAAGEGSVARCGRGGGVVVMGVGIEHAAIEERFQSYLKERAKPNEIVVARLIYGDEQQEPR